MSLELPGGFPGGVVATAGGAGLGGVAATAAVLAIVLGVASTEVGMADEVVAA